MNKNYLRYCMYLILSLILTTIGAGIGVHININYKVLLVLSIVLILIFMFAKGIVKQFAFIIFCFGEGLCLSPIVYSISNTSLMLCLGLTTLIVGICMIIGLISKDLSGWQNYLFVVLTVIVLYGIVGIFITLPNIAWIIILVFALYVCFDMNCFKLDSRNRTMSNDEILDHVMNMYLDILNILIELIKIFGDSDD